MMDLRYERKYRLPDRGLQPIVQQIKMLPAGFKTLFPDRQINNVYFDTPELKTYHENVMGIPDRSKYRLRWYGQDITMISNPNYEIKTKHGELGFKTMVKWDGDFLLNWEVLKKEMAHRDSSGLVLLPSLVNSYLRSYYISADGFFRLTIDRNVVYYPVLKSQLITLSPIRESILIIEIKYSQDHEDRANELFIDFPFRQTKNSKYVNGIMMTCG